MARSKITAARNSLLLQPESEMTRKPQTKSKKLIAVLGVTGAGKTTLISRATGRNDLEIGHSLESCECFDLQQMYCPC